MRVLGVDPGLATTGWGVVEPTSSGGCRVLSYGVILTPAGQPLADRLKRLAEELRGIVARERPALAAVEELFFVKNGSSAASVGHGRGALLLTLAELGLPIHEYNPRQVKTALTGYGAADKYQMQNMVQRFLGLKDLPRPDDAADALAIALCHLNTVKIKDGGRGIGVRELI